MEKVIIMGWAKFPNEARRHKITVRAELRVNEKGKVTLSMFGEIKGRAYGQCADTIREYAVEKRQNFNEIMDIWAAWHLKTCTLEQRSRNKPSKGQASLTSTRLASTCKNKEFMRTGATDTALGGYIGLFQGTCSTKFSSGKGWQQNEKQC